MSKCIKCNTETSHSICNMCADELISKMSRKDLIAHALVGMDAQDGKPQLIDRLKKYKRMLRDLTI